MKTYSKLLNRSALMCASVFMFWSSNASALKANVEIPTTSEDVLISAPPASLQIVSVNPFVYNGNVNIRCWGQKTGRATVVTTGGVAPLTYEWSGMPNQTGATAVGMAAGTYTVTVTDASGVSVSGTVTLVENPPLEAIATVTPVPCNGGVGIVTLSAIGGTAPYSGLDAYYVVPGTYTYILADANGCRNQVSATVTEPPVFEATATAVPILCNGDVTEVLVEGFGGTPPYNSTGVYTEYAGSSFYAITDANGCYAYTTINISEPAPVTAQVSHTPIICRGGTTEITVSGSGGVGNYIGEGVYTQFAGQYQYTVIDGNGCANTSSINITQPSAVVANISNTPIACAGGLSTVQINATGGTAPYFGTGNFQAFAGLHTYTVSDMNGCTVAIATQINEPDEIQLEINWAPIPMNASTTLVEVAAIGGTPYYSGTGLFDLSEGMYTHTVIDANGCMASQDITIGPPGELAISIAGMQEATNGSIKSNGFDEANKSFVQAAFNISSEELEFSYRLKYDSKVRFEIYDMTGALVDVIDEDMATEGENYTVSIAPGKLKNGVYIYQFVTDVETRVDKLQIFDN